MITTNNINTVRKEIQKLKNEKKEIIVEAQDDAFNRKIFEIKDVDMVLNLEFNRKDRLKQRDSGLNEILAKLAKKNNITIGIDITKIKSLNPLEKGKVLSRIKQNIKLCKRTKAKIKILNTDKKSASSLILSLGGNTSQAKEATA